MLMLSGSYLLHVSFTFTGLNLILGIKTYFLLYSEPDFNFIKYMKHSCIKDERFLREKYNILYIIFFLPMCLISKKK